MNNKNIQPCFPIIRILSADGTRVTTKCYIDDIEVPKVRSVDFHVAADEAPTATFEVLAMPDINMFADVRFDFTPKTVQEACVVLKNELSKRSDVFNGFAASTESVLRENIDSALYDNDSIRNIAHDIVKRIIGES